MEDRERRLRSIVHAFLPMRASKVLLEPYLSLAFQDALKTHSRVSHVYIGTRPKSPYHFMIARKTSKALRTYVRRLDSHGVLCLLGPKGQAYDEIQDDLQSMIRLTWDVEPETPSETIEVYMKQ